VLKAHEQVLARSAECFLEGDGQQYRDRALRRSCQVENCKRPCKVDQNAIFFCSKYEHIDCLDVATRLCMCRLRQNLQVPAEGRAAELNGTSPENKTQQYLRLPIESAKKLRWYDRPDLNNLIQQNLREKNDLLKVNAALRQVRLC